MSETIAPADIPVTVHIGAWTNWTYGRIRGATLTVTQQNGSLLTAFIAVFVGYTSTLLWRISCLLLHKYFSSPRPMDTLYHHRQAVLRNAPSGAAGAWEFTKILWAWRRRARIARSIPRLIPTLLVAVIFWIVFTLVSVFSSRVSSIMGDEVLLSSPNCGRSDSVDSIFPVPMLEKKYFLWNGHANTRNGRAREQAISCYGSSQQRDTRACEFFSRPYIESTVDKNASCPMEESMCKIKTGNILLTARINSHHDLGLNTPPSERLDLIWKTHCGPIQSQDYKDQWSYSDAVSYSRYYYGPSGQDKYTTLSENTDFDQITVANPIRADRNILVDWSVSLDGTEAPLGSFSPIPELAIGEPRSEIYLVHMQANGARFHMPVDDPWYSSNIESKGRDYRNPNQTILWYYADEALSTLACKVSFQVCRIDGDCSRSGSIIDVYNEQQANPNTHSELLERLLQILPAIAPPSFPAFFGPSSLLEPQIAKGGMRSDRWHDDVIFWQSQFLAALQGSMTDAAIGTPTELGEDGESLWIKAKTPEERRYCGSQKIRSTAYTNISILWMSVIFSLGVVIIVLEWSLEPLMAWSSTRKGRPKYALAEWQAYESLQLVRLVHEQLGYGGIWTEDKLSGVPLPSIDEELAVVDMNDPSHVQLQPKSSMVAAHELKDPQTLFTVASVDTSANSSKISSSSGSIDAADNTMQPKSQTGPATMLNDALPSNPMDYTASSGGLSVMNGVNSTRAPRPESVISPVSPV